MQVPELATNAPTSDTRLEPVARIVTESERSVVIVINALHSGGAERTCIELARRLDEYFNVEVVALVCGGPAEHELRSLGVKVTTLDAAVGLHHRLLLAWKLARLLRRTQPDVVITFLYIADFVGSVLARLLLRRTRIFWNVRNNVLSRSQMGSVSHAVFRLNALTSRFLPSGIVYCSPIARAQHESRGYRSKQSYVVENSHTSVPFAFSAAKRSSFKRRGANGEFVFLFVGRFDPVKRVDIYIEACAWVYRNCGGGVRFLIAGRDMDAANASLRSLLYASGIPERFELLGHVADQQALYSAADCLVVTSESEGSPNVVYEAMATKLQTVILATLGTETINGWGIHRVDNRSTERLVAMMCDLVSCGVPAESSRLVSAYQPMEHPLARFYKVLLSVDSS